MFPILLWVVLYSFVKSIYVPVSFCIKQQGMLQFLPPKLVNHTLCKKQERSKAKAWCQPVLCNVAWLESVRVPKVLSRSLKWLLGRLKRISSSLLELEFICFFVQGRIPPLPHESIRICRVPRVLMRHESIAWSKPTLTRLSTPSAIILTYQGYQPKDSSWKF